MAATSTASRDIAYQLHPFTNLRKHEEEGPLVITGGHGIYVTDEAGREYIEAMAGLWCASLGFGEERLVEAAIRQMRRLPYYHQFNSKAHDTAVNLAERLIGLLPVRMSKIFFNNSGSEANDTAVKLVWYYNNVLGRPRKKKIISRLRGYHGITVASGSLTGIFSAHRNFDLPLPQMRHAECPDFYRHGRPGESEEDFATRMAESLDALILREDPETVAAFIAEPVMGAGGVVVPPRTYFDKVQAVLKKHDVLFIADEVICGFGRTGRMFGSETYDLKPDIMVMAKALSSAYLPISATAISEGIYQSLVSGSDKVGVFAHGYTYSGHPVPCAVALETLDVMKERDLLGHVATVGPRLQAGLRRFADHPLVGNVRGVGLLGAVELVKDRATRAPFDTPGTVGGTFQTRAQAHGLIVRNLGDTIALCPPLIITEAEVDEVLRRFEKALSETSAA
ncbi:MAG TPA: aspartate aminotransferase family protein [Verrucomicrobiae bacterium]|jgi:4-aminobutyrate--pyruvate transaminase|nr:aspartate aminotransferase family protein [Verrucomicrobiae bacterium]